MKQNIDVPVAMIFFNRPDQFNAVFEAVKSARPSKLFLIQDGPREGRKDDLENIMRCREILDGIDWDCEVHRNFSDENLGCGRRVYTGLTWAFEYVDRLIILEDDTVPCISWFSFAHEILEKYKDDARIGMITGVNHLGRYEVTGLDYVFATCGSIAGWATWKRVWDNNDYDVSFVDSDYYMKLLSRTIYPSWIVKGRLMHVRQIRKNIHQKRTSWSGPFGFSMYLNSQLVVVPCVNLIKNIGLTPQATNGGTSKRILPKKLQSIFDAPTFELTSPLKHPRFVIEDRIYADKLYSVMNGGNSWLGRLFMRIESYIRIILVRYLKALK